MTDEREQRRLQWEAALRGDYNAQVAIPRSIKLPKRIDYSGDPRGDAVLTIDASAVIDNMQKNGAAFEAWALALKLWLGTKTITLDWQEPSSPMKRTAPRHYERFLFRAFNFQTLFPWFRVAHPARFDGSRALGGLPLWLNVADNRDKATSAKESRRKRLEHDLEMRLKSDPAFPCRFGLEIVDNQFPVGLFADPAPSDNVFPGGKSAIDLVGYGKAIVASDEMNTFALFELKASDNIPAGALSELLLYTALVREAAATQPRISFCKGTRSAGCMVGADHVRSCQRILSVLLTEDIHPLLEHPQLVPSLNAAASQHWNTEGHKPVTFAFEKV